MTIPEIRERLLDIADALSCVPLVAAEIRMLAEATRRRPAHRVAPVKSHPMTEGASDQIRDFAECHPHASHMEIAYLFGVNIGRVSEALRGKRQ